MWCEGLVIADVILIRVCYNGTIGSITHIACRSFWPVIHSSDMLTLLITLFSIFWLFLLGICNISIKANCNKMLLPRNAPPFFFSYILSSSDNYSFILNGFQWILPLTLLLLDGFQWLLPLTLWLLDGFWYFFNGFSSLLFLFLFRWLPISFLLGSTTSILFVFNPWVLISHQLII